MDTFVFVPKKNNSAITKAVYATTILGVFLLPCIFKGVPLFAQENLKLANNVIISPFATTQLENNIVQNMSLEEQTKKFDDEIRHKYRGGAILTLDRGVKHIRVTKFYQGRPVKINVVEINQALNPNIEVAPALASTSLARKNTITTIAKRNNSLVAINGTYFKPQTGVPLGTLMINGKMITGPIYNRVAMGIFDTHYDMARVQLNASLKTRKETVKIDNINQPRMLSTYVIAYSDAWGLKAPISPKYGKQVVINEDNKITAISVAQQNIPKGGFVIVAPESKISGLKVGDAVKLNFDTIPDWKNVKHIISGGPYLIRKGETYIDIKEEKLLSVGGRNPRTAIGYTADNHLVIVIVDGREKASIGLTLSELAHYMTSIGCYEAMNLDGGGSTVMYVNGRVVNQPAQKGGIALSNALTLNRIN